jgi:hypothetical protein
LLLAGVREWLEVARKEPWRREEQKYQLVSWLQLLSLSDRPSAVLDGIELLESFVPQVWEFRSIISAIAASPREDAERIILDLARLKPQIAKMDEWVFALLGRGSSSAVLGLMEYLREVGNTAANTIDGWQASRLIVPIVQNDAVLRAALVRIYQDPSYTSCRGILEQVFAEAADPEALLAMVRFGAHPGHNLSRWLRRATEAAVTTHRSLGGNSYQIEPVPSAELRQRLFSIIVVGGRLGKVAKACLVHIDEVRDEYGILDEPRHPNLSSGIPWPSPLSTDNQSIDPTAQ